MKLQTKTVVDSSALERWCEEMPECAEFLENFFGSCGPYEYDTNLVNYLMDLDQQKEIDPRWNEYHSRLVDAFSEIAYRSEVLN